MYSLSKAAETALHLAEMDTKPFNAQNVSLPLSIKLQKITASQV